jgi:hypothetical protein
MCTYDTCYLTTHGSFKAAGQWKEFKKLVLYFDHPSHNSANHTLNIDIIENQESPRAVALELPLDCAISLAEAINKLLEQNKHLIT